jgi:hypothetical protein
MNSPRRPKQERQEFRAGRGHGFRQGKQVFRLAGAADTTAADEADRRGCVKKTAHMKLLQQQF